MTEPTGGSRLDRGRLQSLAVQGAMWTMLHTVVSLPIAFVVNLLLARALEPTGYGRLALLTTIITLAGSVLTLGLEPAMVQFGSKAHAAGRTEEVTRLLRSSQTFRLLIVSPALTVLIIAVIDVPLPLLLLAIVFGIWIPAVLEGGPITLAIENKTAAGARNAMITNLIVQVGVVVTVLWIGTADSVWAARIILGAVGVALAVIEMGKAYRRVLLRPRLRMPFPKGFWRFAIPTGLAGLIGQLALQRTEVLYLSWWSTPETVGLFALAYGLAGHIFAPAQALTGPLIPAISALREVGEDHVVRAFRRTLRASSTVVALLTTASIPALVFLVPVLYGDDFAAAAPAVLVLGLVGGAAVIAGPLSAFVLARLSGRLFLIANIAALVVNVAVAVVLIPTIGLWGAVAANAAGTLTRFGVLLVSEVRDLELAPSDVLPVVLPILLAAVACVVAWGLVGQLTAHELVQAPLACLLALALLVIGMRSTQAGLTRGDRDVILSAVPGRLRPVVRRVLSVVTTGDPRGRSGR